MSFDHLPEEILYTICKFCTKRKTRRIDIWCRRYDTSFAWGYLRPREIVKIPKIWHEIVADVKALRTWRLLCKNTYISIPVLLTSFNFCFAVTYHKLTIYFNHDLWLTLEPVHRYRQHIQDWEAVYARLRAREHIVLWNHCFT